MTATFMSWRSCNQHRPFHVRDVLSPFARKGLTFRNGCRLNLAPERGPSPNPDFPSNQPFTQNIGRNRHGVPERDSMGKRSSADAVVATRRRYINEWNNPNDGIDRQSRERASPGRNGTTFAVPVRNSGGRPRSDRPRISDLCHRTPVSLVTYAESA